MSDEQGESSETLSLEQAPELDRASDRFEAGWRGGQRPLIEDYLAGLAEPILSA